MRMKLHWEKPLKDGGNCKKLGMFFEQGNFTLRWVCVGVGYPHEKPPKMTYTQTYPQGVDNQLVKIQW